MTRATIEQWKRASLHRCEAESLFDSLAPVRSEELVGLWSGSGLHTGHPLDGLLAAYKWFGKRFVENKRVHPLLFESKSKRLISVNPIFAPVRLALMVPTLAHSRIAISLFENTKSLLSTSEPTADLVDTQFRGELSATMRYDAHPISDHFRKIDETLILGLMSVEYDHRPLFFCLQKCTGPAPFI